MRAAMMCIFFARGATWVACDNRLTSLLSILLGLLCRCLLDTGLLLALFAVLLTSGPPSLRLTLLNLIIAAALITAIPGLIRSYEGN